MPLQYLTAVGALVIEALTIICALYLIWSLSKQGWGKVRVRLLLGMVASDLMLGIVALIPNALFLAGHALQTGSAGCNATGFLITSTLFTQHAWTLLIAVSTYLLLRHPLSRWTTWLDKHAAVMPIIIWVMSLVHSGVWWAKIGFASTGYLCYYQSDDLGIVDGKDLVQFIPRAFVFIVVLCLYSRLFSFLRRPDTIQLSTQRSEGTSQSFATKFKCPRKALAERQRQARSSGPEPESLSQNQIDQPPWEKLEIAQYGEDTASNAPTVHSIDKMRTQELFYNSISPLEPKYSAASTYTESHAPVLSVTVLAQDEESDDEDGKDGDTDEDRVEMERRDTGQTLTEFFKENQAVTGETSRANDNSNSDGSQEMSASNYLNRQASLLMLWFPLAYLVVFSISLVRLIYDMVHDKPNPVLTLLSFWMVLSIGLIDFLVFGLAELVIRRRVRRKIPSMAP